MPWKWVFGNQAPREQKTSMKSKPLDIQANPSSGERCLFDRYVFGVFGHTEPQEVGLDV